MAYLDKIKSELSAELGTTAADLVYTPQSELGDLSWPLFEEAKKIGINPVLLAKQKAEQLEQKLPMGVKAVKAVGPYLNFFCDGPAFIQGLLEEVNSTGDKFGTNLDGQDYKIIIEYSNANTHKEIHIGHVRNISFGDSVQKILKANGYKVVPVSFVNDFGINTAKTIWGWQQHPEYALKLMPKGYLLGQAYSAAVAEIGDDEVKKEEIGRYMQAIESRQGDIYKLWQETRRWSLDYFDEIYRDLDIRFDQVFYESELIDAGQKIVQDLLTKGVFTRSQGAIIADLSAYNLGVLPFIRSNGTALYPVADLALASYKFEKYQADESIYVVDVRQGLYFKQLFKIIELMGYNKKLIHLGYDFLTLKTGMMSSRSGNVVTYRQLFSEALGRSRAEIVARHADWDQTKVEDTAKKLAIAAMKFEMIKVSSDKVIVFDMDEALKFDGYTSSYLQYAIARLNSLFKKAAVDEVVGTIAYDLLVAPKEFGLAWKLAQYGEAVSKAGRQYDPSIIARYLFGLAQAFNDYYHDTNILKAEFSVRKARLNLVKAVRQVLLNGFDLLGLMAVNEM